MMRYKMAKHILTKQKNILDYLILTDEKTFKDDRNSKVQYTNRINNTAYLPKHLATSRPASSSSDINIWGFIGPFGKGELLF